MRTGGSLYVEARRCGEPREFSDGPAFPGASGSGVAGGPAGVGGYFASHLVELETAPLGPETGLQLPSPALCSHGLTSPLPSMGGWAGVS